MLMYAVIFLIIVLGGVATFMVGNSKENKQENSEYDKKTSSQWTRLLSYYIISIVGCIIIVIYFLN